MSNPNPNPQMLLLDPKEELRFFGEFNMFNQPKTKLTVTNPTPYSIHYKIKTTAATRYWVSPKMGLLLPYSQEEVIIGMKAPRGETVDKFKLIAIVAPSTGQKSANVWDNFDESRAMTSKLVVVFVDEKEDDFKATPQTVSGQKHIENIPSLTKILTFIMVGFVAVASSLYRLGTR